MIIVTGGAGFIGSNLVAGLEEAGHADIVVCDTLGDGDKWRNIAKREIRDIVRPENLLRYLELHKGEVETIFHLGAVSSTTERDADLIVGNNFTLSRRLWKWCAANGVRLIYASSAATYGDGAQGFGDDGSPEALAKLRPLNPYGWSKHLFDRRVSRLTAGGEAREAAPPQWVGLKFFNVYGPNEYHKGEQESVAGKLYPHIAAGGQARLFKSGREDYKDGGQLRDFIWVGDCVAIMVWMLDHPDICGLFNVGTGEARSFKDLAAAVFEAAEKPAKIAFIDMPDELKDRYQYYTQADVSHLRRVGYDKSFTSLEAGIDLYVKHYLSQPDPYR